MNKETVILKKISLDKMNDLMHEIMSKTEYILSKTARGDRSKVCVAVPNYFFDIISANTMHGLFNINPVRLSKPDNILGCKIVPAFNNNITVYHVDTPLYDYLQPEIIKISDYE